MPFKQLFSPKRWLTKDTQLEKLNSLSPTWQFPNHTEPVLRGIKVGAAGRQTSEMLRDTFQAFQGIYLDFSRWLSQAKTEKFISVHRQLYLGQNILVASALQVSL